MEQPSQGRKDAEPTRKRKRKRRHYCNRRPQEGPHSPIVTANSGLPLVRILPRLKPVLDFLDVKGDVFTRAQIMRHLREYIKKKALYDPSDPRKVYCENDKLGEIFNCKEFSTANVCKLLLQNLENISTTNSSEPDCLNRTSCYSMLCCPPCKRTSVASTDICSCSESDQSSTVEFSCSSSSIVAASVPPVHLTGEHSSTSAASISLPNNPVHLTGQHPSTSAASVSLPNNPVDLTGQRPSTSAASVSLPNNPGGEPTDSICLTEYSRYYQGISENVTDVVTDTSDDLFFLDETDEERVVRQVDSDEGRFSPEYDPNSFSEEESLEEGDEEEELDSGDTEVDEGDDGGDELDTNDSSDSEVEEADKWQCEACSERNHPIVRRCRRCFAVRTDSFPTSLDRTTSGPSRIQTEMAQFDPKTNSASTSRIHTRLVSVASVSTNSEENDAYRRMKCILCLKEPPSGCIVHGRTGHQVCCVLCARKLKESNKQCPVCRKKISKVIKNYM